MLLAEEWRETGWLDFLPSPWAASQQTTQELLWMAPSKDLGWRRAEVLVCPGAAGCKVRLPYRRSSDLLRVTVGGLFYFMLDWCQTGFFPTRCWISYKSLSNFFSSCSAGVCGGLHRNCQSKEQLHPKNWTFKARAEKKRCSKAFFGTA